MPRRKKILKFDEIKILPNVIEMCYEDSFKNKDKVNKFFQNNNPIVLEIGCGRGEYTLDLASCNKNTNFIGIDIKGERIWKGAKIALEKNMNNVLFLRAEIEHLENIFDENTINSIWVTFPDPQMKKPKKSLISSKFLMIYKKILNPNSILHLKTDNDFVYSFGLEELENNGFDVIYKTDDLYKKDTLDEYLNIETYYEKLFKSKGSKIKYCKCLIS